MIELTAQEYKDILSTLDRYKKGAEIVHYSDNENVREEYARIDGKDYLWAIEQYCGDTIKHSYYLIEPFPYEYQIEAPMTVAIEAKDWNQLKEILIAAGVAK